MSAGQRRAVGAAKAPKIVTVLCARWPKAFALDGRKRRPLKVGIVANVIAASAPGITKGIVSKAKLAYAANLLKARKAGKRAANSEDPSDSSDHHRKKNLPSTVAGANQERGSQSRKSSRYRNGESIPSRPLNTARMAVSRIIYANKLIKRFRMT